jgi:hypothetical protein
MRPEVYWIDMRGSARLAIMPRPRAGDRLGDEIAGWQRVEIRWDGDALSLRLLGVVTEYWPHKCSST